MPSKHFIVSGIVQGVFFRKYTQNKAHELQLRGAVRNLSDGTVEIWAKGKATDLASFERWLWQGSPQSKVRAVEVEEIEGKEWTDFRILPSN